MPSATVSEGSVTGSGGGGDGSGLDESRVQGLVDSARASFQSLEDKIHLQEHVDSHPWRTLGIALAAGYVIGGGLFSPLTGRLFGLGLRLGLRAAALPVIRQELYGLAGAVKESVSGGAS